MGRIHYVDPDNATEAQKLFCEDLTRVRGDSLENIFLALANVPPLAQGVLAMASSLRRSTILSRNYRELAVVAVGIETGARYELEHHWRIALRSNVSQAQLLALPDYLSSDAFTPQERAVIAFAVESTRHARVATHTWDQLEFLGSDARLELVLTVAWYNGVSRIVHALDLDTEEWLPAADIPEDLAFA